VGKFWAASLKPSKIVVVIEFMWCICIYMLLMIELVELMGDMSAQDSIVAN
jgi:hypothetical protein